MFAPGGVLLSLSCIASLSLFLGLWFIMMVVLVLLWILLSGRPVVPRRSVGLRCGIGLFLPGPPDLWVGAWVGVAVTPPLRAVILKFGLILLVCWSSGSPFFILCIGLLLGAVLVWVVCLMWSCSFCMSLWAGERLELEKAVPRYRRPGRPISVSAVPFGPGTDIWRSCRFIGALFRGLRDLFFGLRRDVPCDIGANHCRLRHIGWERCGHGLTSRPRESASEDF